MVIDMKDRCLSDLIFAMGLFREFSDKLLYEQRYYLEHEYLLYLKRIIIDSIVEIPNDFVFYRSRKFAENLTELNINEYVNTFHQREAGFEGFGKNKSHIPPQEKAKEEGRVNLPYIRCLYVAEDVNTAIAEIRPYVGNLVSVAEIKTREPLVIVDFSLSKMSSLESSISDIGIATAYAFQRPIDSTKKDYIVTQFISEFVKTNDIGGKRIDGIRYESSLNRDGKNLAIFNFDKCEPISSKIHQIEELSFKSTIF